MKFPLQRTQYYYTIYRTNVHDALLAEQRNAWDFLRLRNGTDSAWRREVSIALLRLVTDKASS
jgi:hypothetical protein